MEDRSNQHQNPISKPYAFVPLTETSCDTRVAGHHRYQRDTLSGTLTATIVALSPVHVASGLIEHKPGKAQYPLFKAHFRTNGILAIPGTSLKGCIRSIVEAITNSGVLLTKASIDKKYKPCQSQQSGQIKLDSAQHIFGALGYQGLVNFADAPLINGNAEIVTSLPLFAPRPAARHIYFDNNKPRGRKFYLHGQLAKGNLPLEACSINSQFQLRMDFINLTGAQLGVILVAMGLGKLSFCPKLGGGKPVCLGTIKIREPVINYDNPYARYTGNHQPASGPDHAELIREAQGLIIEHQVQKLANILRCPNTDRNCPDRSY
ncbi:RAMP superfamily CRISPR-associated protein [Chloroflexus sp.]|uniref:RAMP superfamily CRISPR-associated protein n=1 Tax=Chloroflexus sp. TaxID=1904827 RepID=UPI0026054FF5|nr:RAMP superfamily CRISPR-associated protein [uncultured Chloroflexus sp.]